MVAPVAVMLCSVMPDPTAAPKDTMFNPAFTDRSNAPSTVFAKVIFAPEPPEATVVSAVLLNSVMGPLMVIAPFFVDILAWIWI